MTFRFFDGALGLGRCNRQPPDAPTTPEGLLRLMDRYDIAEALVYHFMARDCDPELGNQALPADLSPRLHRVWAIESAAVCPEPVTEFVDRALDAKARAFLYSPMQTDFRLNHSARLSAIAGILAERRIPLLLTYRTLHGGENLIDWPDLTQFCRRHPDLPVLVTQQRLRVNRPLFDALAATENLRVSVSMLWQHRMIDQVADAYGPRRLFFSTGLPGLDPGSFQMAIAYARLSEDARQAIAFGNLKGLIDGRGQA